MLNKCKFSQRGELINCALVQSAKHQWFSHWEEALGEMMLKSVVYVMRRQISLQKKRYAFWFDRFNIAIVWISPIEPQGKVGWRRGIWFPHVQVKLDVKAHEWQARNSYAFFLITRTKLPSMPAWCWWRLIEHLRCLLSFLHDFPSEICNSPGKLLFASALQLA